MDTGSKEMIVSCSKMRESACMIFQIFQGDIDRCNALNRRRVHVDVSYLSLDLRGSMAADCTQRKITK